MLQLEAPVSPCCGRRLRAGAGSKENSLVLPKNGRPMRRSYEQAICGGRGWVETSLARIKLLSVFDVAVLFLIFLTLILAQGVRIFDEARIVGVTRLVFDSFRGLLAFVFVISAYRLLPVFRNAPAHKASLSRFQEDTRKLEQASRTSLVTVSPSLSEAIYSQLDLILSRAAALLGNDLRGDCRLTVKVLVEAPEDLADRTPHIITLLRDPRSRVPGERSLTSFSYKRDSAFEAIIDQKKTYFASDDLLDLAAHGEYKNANEKWFRIYNSTVVVPIGSAKSSSPNALIGFLCIDSFEMKLNKAFVRQRLVEYASLIYDLLSVYSKSYALDRTREGSLRSPEEIGWQRIDETIEPADRALQRKDELCFPSAEID